jgi:hypothetical protein
MKSGFLTLLKQPRWSRKVGSALQYGSSGSHQLWCLIKTCTPFCSLVVQWSLHTVSWTPWCFLLTWIHSFIISVDIWIGAPRPSSMTAGLCELDQLSLVLSQFPLEFKPGGVGPSTHLKLTLSMNTLAFAHTHKITQCFFNELWLA